MLLCSQIVEGTCMTSSAYTDKNQELLLLSEYLNPTCHQQFAVVNVMANVYYWWHIADHYGEYIFTLAVGPVWLIHRIQ